MENVILPSERAILSNILESTIISVGSERVFSQEFITPLMFCVAASILFPDVRVYRGGVFLSWVGTAAIDQWFDSGRSMEDVERIANKCRVWDLFRKDDCECGSSVDLICQKLIGRTWEKYLPAITQQNVKVLIEHEVTDFGPSISFFVAR